MCPLQLNHLDLSYLGWEGILEKEEILVFPLAGYLAKVTTPKMGSATDCRTVWYACNLF